MLVPLILAATVAAASPAPAPAWEPLACIYCEPDEARAAGWSFEAAMRTDTPARWRDYILPDALRGQRYATQRQCLAALRRALPVVTDEWDDAGQITTRRHRRDHVEEHQSIPGVQSASALFGCFEHAQAVS
jgi:hypothetical protein